MRETFSNFFQTEDPFDVFVGMNETKTNFKRSVLDRMLSKERIATMKAARCVVCFGESGTGKSFFVRCAFRYVERYQIDPVFCFSYVDESSFSEAVARAPSLLLVENPKAKVLKIFSSHREAMNDVTVIFTFTKIETVDPETLSLVDYSFFFGFPTYNDRVCLIEDCLENARMTCDVSLMARASFGLVSSEVKNVCRKAIVDKFFSHGDSVEKCFELHSRATFWRVAEALTREHPWLFDGRKSILLLGRESVFVRKAIEANNRVRHVELAHLKIQVLLGADKIATAIHFWNPKHHAVFEEIRFRGIVVVASDQFANVSTCAARSYDAASRWFDCVIDADTLVISASSATEILCRDSGECTLVQLLSKLKK